MRWDSEILEEGPRKLSFDFDRDRGGLARMLLSSLCILASCNPSCFWYCPSLSRGLFHL